MTLGRAPTQGDALRTTRSFCENRLSPTSVYRLLHEECHRIFPDDAFADLFTGRGRDSVPPRLVAVVMVLQRMEGLSDRDAVDRFTFDARWKYAAGGLDFEYPGFVHTVLVDMRARLRDSERPNRIFEAVLDVAKSAGLVGRKRVLDSTALYDAVATQDTVTMIRGSIRGLLRVADEGLVAELRSVLKRDDDYASPGKPACNWDDEGAREALIDALARDAYAALACLDGRDLAAAVKEAAALVATVVGQDLEQRDDGVFRIARRVAPNRVISTVDPEARHGHKTAARGFDGYKGHVAIDPDSEIITATTVTPGNASDGSVALDLLADVLPPPSGTENLATPDAAETQEAEGLATGAAEVQDAEGLATDAAEAPATPNTAEMQDADRLAAPDAAEVSATPNTAEPQNAEGLATPDAAEVSTARDAAEAQIVGVSAAPAAAEPSTATSPLAEVYGDASYGTGEILAQLEGRAVPILKVQAPSNRDGMYSKGSFEMDLEGETVKCPAGVLVQIQRRKTGEGTAEFGTACKNCLLRDQCTKSKSGRVVQIHKHERLLDRERKRQQQPGWKEIYRGTRPKVERKLAHMMKHRHGGRRSRVRGRDRTDHDFALLAASVNLKRLATLSAAKRSDS